MLSSREITTPLHAALAWSRLWSRFTILGNSFVGKIDRSTERHALPWCFLGPTDSEE